MGVCAMKNIKFNITSEFLTRDPSLHFINHNEAKVPPATRHSDVLGSGCKVVGTGGDEYSVTRSAASAPGVEVRWAPVTDWTLLSFKLLDNCRLKQQSCLAVMSYIQNNCINTVSRKALHQLVLVQTTLDVD